MTFQPGPLVAAGVALLDEKLPGWEARVNLDTLDISSGNCCMIAQLTGTTYFSGRMRLDIELEQAISCGFNVVHRVGRNEPMRNCEALTTEWKRVIKERLAA